MRHSIRCALVLVSLAGVSSAAAEKAKKPQTAAKAEAPPEAKLIEGYSWREIGPFRGGRVTAVAGVAGQPQVYYMGGTGGGVFKTTNGGTELGADDRRAARRPARSAPSRSRPRTRTWSTSAWARAASAATCPTATASTGRRDAGKTLDAPGTARDEADRPHPRPPAQSRPRVRGRARAHLGPQPGARRLPLEGRRQDLGEGAVRRRQHGRRRPRDGSLEPERALRGHLAGAADALEPRERRSGERPLQDDGRRRHLEEARRRGPAEGPLGPRRRERLGIAAGARCTR